MWVGMLKNSEDIFFILILILLLLILLFVSENQNQTTHAILYYLIKMSYYMPLLTLTPNILHFYFNCKSDSFTRVVTSDVVPDHRVDVYSSKRFVFFVKMY